MLLKINKLSFSAVISFESPYFMSNCIICLSLLIFLLTKIENEKIISQIVGIDDGCDQSGDRCSYPDKI